MIKVCMILKRKDYLQIIGRAAAPLVATALRSNKPKNIYRFVKCYPCKCHNFVSQFNILTIQLYYILSV
jgi:hypothetical protein